MIKIENLTKVYGDKRGVSNISFSVNSGEVVGLLGSNGAGKSTIMNMMAGYMQPTSGSIIIEECDVVRNPGKAGEKIGFLPEIPPLYVDMTVERYLTFLAEIRKTEKNGRKEHINSVMELANILQVKERLIKNLSKGYRQRVGLAQALIGNAQVLILDEPTVGLDPRQINEVRNLILELSKNHTIILSSHILSEIKLMCKRVIIINEGRLIADESIENIEKGEKNRFVLQANCTSDTLLNALANITNVENTEVLQTKEDSLSKIIVQIKEGEQANLISALVQAGIALTEFKPFVKTLEETFISLTAQAEDDTHAKEEG